MTEQHYLFTGKCATLARRLTADLDFDDGHNWDHLQKVARTAAAHHYHAKIPGWTLHDKLAVLIPAALFHEFRDEKLMHGVDVSWDMMVAMKEDGLSTDEIQIVQWIVGCCSFSKRADPERQRLDMQRYVPLLEIVSSADLLDAVGPNALDRCAVYNARRTGNHDPVAVLGFVREFMENLEWGYAPRLGNITVSQIRALADRDSQALMARWERMKTAGRYTRDV